MPADSASHFLEYFDRLKPLFLLPVREIIESALDRYEALRRKNILGDSGTVNFAASWRSESGLQSLRRHFRDRDAGKVSNKAGSVVETKDEGLDGTVADSKAIGSSSNRKGIDKNIDSEAGINDGGDDEEDLGDEVVKQYEDDEIDFPHNMDADNDNEPSEEEKRVLPKPSKLNLEFSTYESSPSEIESFFPSYCLENVSFIIDKLTFQRPLLGKRVYLLDVLTVLVIVLRGAKEDKAAYLFHWYNVSGTSIMTQLEHALFIKRAGDCLYKLGIIGSIDMTMDDAKHLAFLARARKPEETPTPPVSEYTHLPTTSMNSTSTQLPPSIPTSSHTEGKRFTFVPGLYYQDFYEWITTNKEVGAIFQFFKVLDRLVEILVTLKNRTDNVLKIEKEKAAYREHACSVPRIDMFSCTFHDSPLNVTFRSQHTISLCISSTPLNHKTTEIYVKCQKIFPRATSYSMAPNITKHCQETLTQLKENRRANNLKEFPKCCEKLFSLEFHQRCLLNQPLGLENLTSLTRVDIGNLEPGSRYVFTLYTDKWVFRQVEAKTLAYPVPINDSRTFATSYATSDTSSDHTHPTSSSSSSPSSNSSSSSSSVCLLPASLSISDAQSFIKSTPDVNASDMIVFTGTLCSCEEIIRRSILYMELDEASKPTPDRYASSIEASARAAYQSHWQNAVQALYGICAADGVNVNGLLASRDQKQIVAISGMGPWSSPESKDQLIKRIGSKHFLALRNRIESLYAKFMKPINPASYSWQKSKNLICFFLQDPNIPLSPEEIRSNCTSNAGISAEDLSQKLVHMTRDSTYAGNHDNCLHMVLMIRSPLDLMAPTVSWGQASASNKVSSTPPPVASSSAFGGVTIPTMSHAAPSTKLRGKHEIIHGEYSSSMNVKQAQQAQIIMEKQPLPLPQAGQIETSSISSSSSSPSSSSSSMQHDKVFSNLIFSLIEWLRHKKSIGSERQVKKVTIVSSGWIQGCNFEIFSSIQGERDVCISHECLLPTRTQFDLRAPLQENSVDWSNSDYYSSENQCDLIMNRIKESLPDCNVEMKCNAPSGLRVAVFKDNLENKPTDSSFAGLSHASSHNSLEFLPVNKILDKSIDFFGTKTSFFSKEYHKSVRVVNGPRIQRVTHHDAIVVARMMGFGRVTATLYELPMFVDHFDAIALLVSERPYMKKVSSIVKRCTAYHDLVFHFEGLEPYCCYCVCLDPYDDIPPIAHFRTQALPTSLMTSMVISSVCDGDYSLPSFGLLKTIQLLEMQRPPATPVHLIYHNDNGDDLLSVGLPKPNRVNVDNLYKMTNVIHTCEESGVPSHSKTAETPFSRVIRNFDFANSYEGNNRAGIHMTFSGKFARLAPRNGSIDCLYELIEAILAIEYISSPAKIEHITVITQKPLIRFLRRQPDGRWLCDGPAARYRYACSQVFASLLNWKSRSEGRDCVVYSMANIPAIKTVLIQFKAGTPEAAAAAAAVTAASASVGGGSADNFDENASYHSVQTVSEIGDGGAFGNPTGTAEDGTGTNSFDVQSVATSARYPLPSLAVFQEWSPVSLRHIILPTKVGGPDKKPAVFLLPKGSHLLGFFSIEYRVLDENSVSDNEIMVYKQRREFYGNAIRIAEEVETAVYLIDVIVEGKEELVKKIVPPPMYPSSSSTDNSVASHPSNLMSADNESVTSFVQQQRMQLYMQEMAKPRCYFHPIHSRSFVHEIDFVDIILGPVVASVTQESCVLHFETNADLRELIVLIKAIGLPAQEFEYSREKVKAYKLFTVKVTGLSRGRTYEIHCPQLYGSPSSSTCLGYIKTARNSIRNVQIAFTGGQPLAGIPLVDMIVEQVGSRQQSPLLQEIRYFSEFRYRKDVSFGGESSEHLAKYEIGSRERGNTWTWISEYLRGIGVSNEIVIHLGSHTLLTTYLSKILRALLEHGKRLHIPLRDASAVAAWYFNQFEEVVKDTFRLLWMIPTIRDALSVGNHMPLFHSDYLVPITSALKAENGVSSDEDEKLLVVIRKMFETHFGTYVSSMYEHKEDNPNHMRIWRSGTFVVVLLDTASERKKVPKKDMKGDGTGGGAAGGGTQGDDEDDNSIVATTESQTEAANTSTSTSTKKPKKASKKKGHPFSPGFIDKNQWKVLKDLADEKFISHLIICSQEPFVPLGEIPRLYQGPDKAEKGSCLPWAPTVDDLDYFFQFWLKWIRPPKDFPDATRQMILCSTHKTPYFTTLLDIHTGLKINQVCTGRFNEADTDIHAGSQGEGGGAGEENTATEDLNLQNLDGVVVASAENDEGKAENARDWALSGKIGTIRYMHQFGALSDVFLDCSRESSSNSADVARRSASSKRSTESQRGYAVMKFWFDSWKASGTWHFITDRSGRMKDTAEPKIIVGPILNSPYLIRDEGTGRDLMVVPILFEVDKHTTLVVRVKESFGGDETIVSIKMRPLRPHVEFFGPFELDCRFNCEIISGAKVVDGQTTFIIATGLNWNENNVIFLNSTLPPDSDRVEGSSQRRPNLCSEFIHSIVDRCKVPFNGITAIFHINMVPDMRQLCEDIRYLPAFKQGLTEARASMTLSPQLFRLLDEIFEKVRDEFRNLLSRPSTAELLRSAYNVFMCNKDYVNRDEVDMADACLLMLQLMIVRASQEYFEQAKKGELDKVYRAFLTSKTILKYLRNGEPTLMITEYENEDDEEDENKADDDEPDFVDINDPDLDPETKAAAIARMKAEEDKVEWDLHRMALLNELEFTDAEDVAVPDNFVYGSKREFHYSDPSIHPVEAVFKQWIEWMSPAHVSLKTWVSPNGKVSVEALGNITRLNLPRIYQMVRHQSPIEYGARIMVMDGGKNDEFLEEMFNPQMDTGLRLQKVFTEWPDKEWKGQGEDAVPGRTDRDLMLLCTTSKYGTKKVPMKFQIGTEMETPSKEFKEGREVPVYGPETFFYALDTIYRCNESERLIALDEQRQADADKKKDSTTGKAKEEKNLAKGKKAEKKRADAERRKEEERLKAINAIIESWIPDGYLIVECRTVLMTSRDEREDILTSISVKAISSLYGGAEAEKQIFLSDPAQTERPTPTDYLQLPEWLIKFSPTPGTIFAQDEVLLNMRQDPSTREVLAYLEGDDMFMAIVGLYESSRLSELSRPPDLREVDMEMPGAVVTFLRNVVQRLWNELLPEEIKNELACLCDDFICSYCLGRAMPKGLLQTCSASDTFARAMQYSLVLAMTLKMSYEMSRSDRWKYILEYPDAPTRIATMMALKDQRRRDAHKKAQTINPKTYDKNKVDEEFEANELKADDKGGYESDMEELDKEDQERLRQEALREEEEERRERAADLAEEEALAAEEAQYALMEQLEKEREAALAAAQEKELAKKKALGKAGKPGGGDGGGAEKTEAELEAEAAKEEAEAEALEKLLEEEALRRIGMEKEVVQKSIDATIELVINEAVEVLVNEQLYEEELEAQLAEAAEEELTDEQRLAEAYLQMSRLSKERLAKRRELGKIVSLLLKGTTGRGVGGWG